ncbi:MAG: DegV family protein [Chloroflexota bacterium]
MTRVALVTDSASDLDPQLAATHGIRVVPLVVNFGEQSYRANVDLSAEAFWDRMTAPEAPFPTTAAASPGEFQAVYESAFAEGAEAIISIHVAETLSGTIRSARIARDLLPGREIHVVDSRGASMIQGLLAFLGAELAQAGRSGAEVAAQLEARLPDTKVYVALETLEYLKRGGRISGTQAAIGTLLSVKPIISIDHGLVETVDRVRTRAKARERLLELIAERPIEKLAVLHTVTPDVEGFRDEVVARAGLDPGEVTVCLVGASVGPHIGPGCLGAAILYRS